MKFGIRDECEEPAEIRWGGFTAAFLFQCGSDIGDTTIRLHDDV
jgi:hypothetical protein